MQVPAADYGLNILDILRAPEKELNQVVGMKRLAPYREDGGATRPNYGKLRELQVGILLLYALATWAVASQGCHNEGYAEVQCTEQPTPSGCRAGG